LITRGFIQTYGLTIKFELILFQLSRQLAKWSLRNDANFWIWFRLHPVPFERSLRANPYLLPGDNLQCLVESNWKHSSWGEIIVGQLHIPGMYTRKSSSTDRGERTEANDGAIGRQFQSLFVVFVCAVCKERTEITYFDFDLKNNIIYGFMNWLLD
jgi:hypothetical protein